MAYKYKCFYHSNVETDRYIVTKYSYIDVCVQVETDSVLEINI